MARASIYLNFPGNTEEAFVFYQSVFGGNFGNDGIARFGDMPAMDGAPPMSGLILMGTDAPQEMGFSVIQGNNVNINLEPDSRNEAERLFYALSDGGIILQPLQEMFWGAYYGQLQDQFGIHWMVNCAH
jgi:PhnB protein